VALKVWGAGNFNVGYARVSLAMALQDVGSLHQAEDQFRQALAVYDKSLPANHQYRAAALMYLARLLVDRGKPEDALPLSEQALSIWMATAPKSSSATAQAHAIHAYVLAHLGRAREAADELSAAVPMLLSARGPDDPAVRRAQSWWNSVRSAGPKTASAN
jgi:tetratricopeptide (TPR) repeat protein